MKKNLLTIVILALLIVNIALTAVMMISVTSTNNKTAALVDTIATVLNLELTDGSADSAVEEISLADTEVYAISSTMTIPLKVAEGEKSVYMVCNISLLLNKNHEDYESLQPTVSVNESVIMDAIRTVITNRTQAECSENQDALKADILKAIQNLYNSDFIYGVAISEVKFG